MFVAYSVLDCMHFPSVHRVLVLVAYFDLFTHVAKLVSGHFVVIFGVFVASVDTASCAAIHPAWLQLAFLCIRACS